MASPIPPCCAVARRPMVCVLLGLAALACAVAAPARPFESPEVLLAADVVPAHLLASAAHRVESRVRLEDNLLRMEVLSDFGTYDVTSLALLEIRAHELSTLAEAIAQYERLNAELAGEIRGRLRIAGDAGVQVLEAPLGSASDLSTQLLENEPIIAARGSSRARPPPPAGPAPRAQGPVFDSHRRNAAYQLRLDVYSSNPQVQRFLDTLASARVHGRFSAGTGLVLSAPVSRVRQVDGGRIEGEVSRLVRHLEAAELNRALGPELARMGADPGVAEAFLTLRWYSPRIRASIAAHADFLGPVAGREALLAAALGARSEAEAISFEQLARMLAVYHERVGRIVRLIPGGPGALPGAMRADGGLVLMLPVDYVFWTPSAQATFDSLRGADGVAAGRPVELVVRGTLSALARRELAARGVQLREWFLATR